jgi:large subunit ribosomal protein L15
MPKLKGFSNAVFKKEYNLVNLTDLAKLAEKGITEINREVLLENGVIRNKTAPIKVLGKGEISAKVSVIAEKASASAQEAVTKAGGTIELK